MLLKNDGGPPFLDCSWAFEVCLKEVASLADFWLAPESSAFRPDVGFFHSEPVPNEIELEI